MSSFAYFFSLCFFHDHDGCHCYFCFLHHVHLLLYCIAPSLLCSMLHDVILPMSFLSHCIMIIMPWVAYLSFVMCSCVNPLLLISTSFLHHAHSSSHSSSSPKFLSHPNFSCLLYSIYCFLVTFFPVQENVQHFPINPI